MNSSKIKTILDAIIKILSAISSLFRKNGDDGAITEIKQDEQTNKKELERINKIIKEKLK